jgi:hypothetical protein
MIGTAQGTVVSTVELQEMAREDPSLKVSVDHQSYEVVSVVFTSANHANVTLEPPFGVDDWVLEVAKADYDEPMWELV